MRESTHFAAMTFSSNDLIAASLRKYRSGGIDCLLDREPIAEAKPAWLKTVEGWVNNYTPRDFSYFRPRWSCEMFAELLWWEKKVRVCKEAIRRGLHQLGYVWRRPRPTVGLTDPQYNRKLQRIQHLIAAMPK